MFNVVMSHFLFMIYGLSLNIHFVCVCVCVFFIFIDVQHVPLQVILHAPVVLLIYELHNICLV